MSPALESDRWHRLNTLFNEALGMDAARRSDYLDDACGSDAELRRELDSLLSAADDSNEVIASTLREAARDVCFERGLPSLTSGSRFLHYEIVSLIGAGGMGQVYLAEDIRLKRKIALKTLAPQYAGDANALLRLEQEARASSALNHPNILTIYDIGEAEKIHYIACEYIDGLTVREKLRSGPLPLNSAIDIAIQVANGLSAAHASGITHRDIKPENIIIRGDGLVKIVDFGIAKLTGEPRAGIKDGSNSGQHPTAYHTASGGVLGTVKYMSPEQARGLPVDNRTDIFSLGAVLYEMTAGVAPFEGETDTDVIAEILKTEPRELHQVVPRSPGELSRIVSKALSKDRSQRYGTAKDLASDLQNLQNRSKVRRNDPMRITLDQRAWVAVALVLIAVAFGTFFLRRRTAPPTNEPRTLAILPFRNLKPDPATDFLGFSLADAVITKFAAVHELIVRPSSSVDRYRNRVIDPERVSAELNVNTLLTGTYLKEGDDLRITTQLISVKPAVILWQRMIDAKYENLFSVQDEIARQIISGLELHLQPGEPESVSRNKRIDQLAYEEYLRGVDLYAQNDFHSAIEMLERSAARAPGYALTWAHLGRAYTTNASLDFGGREQYAKAQAAYEKSLRLNPNLIEARVYMADLLTNTGRVEQALPFLRDALRANPNYAEAHWQLGYAYRFAGLLPESAAECERARLLDPQVKLHSSALNSYLYLGEYKKFLESLPPDDTAYILFYRGFAQYYLGNWAEAARNFDQAYQSDPSLLQAEVGAALQYSIEGRKEEGLRLMRQTEAKVLDRGLEDAEGIFKIAQAYAVLGDKQSALRVLRRSVDGGFFCYPYFQSDPLLAGIRREPAFAEIIKKARSRQNRFRTLVAAAFPLGN
jgi:serine/threonine protein kinase/tetratricopeptide (TPR) repeat protein